MGWWATWREPPPLGRTAAIAALMTVMAVIDFAGHEGRRGCSVCRYFFVAPIVAIALFCRDCAANGTRRAAGRTKPPVSFRRYMRHSMGMKMPRGTA